MNERDDQSRPGGGVAETHYEKEPPGKAGTMGGQAPLKAPAGVQKPGPGGVLTETGKVPKR